MLRLSREQVKAFDLLAFRVRDLATRMIAAAQWGHIGGSYSLAEILAVLYGGFARVDPQNPGWDERDIVVMSKAHCSPALYAVLAATGFIDEAALASYCRIGGLEGHLNQPDTPGVEMSGGSLGIGLSYAAGVALALKKREQFQRRVYVLLGDGELSEGQIWEGAMFAAQYRLDNLIAVVDYNKVMAKGFVYEEIGQEPLCARLTAFGFTVLECDGHDVEELAQAFHRAKYVLVTGRPIAIVAHTVKGRGVARCEFDYRWHTHAPGVEKADEFLRELAHSRGAAHAPLAARPPAPVSLEDVVKGTGHEADVL